MIHSFVNFINETFDIELPSDITLKELLDIENAIDPFECSGRNEFENHGVDFDQVKLSLECIISKNKLNKRKLKCQI